MRANKILSPAGSIIKLFIFILIFTTNSKAEENNIKYYSKDKGILSLMYHRFDENKYPSTNIKMSVFKDQINIIKDLNYKFYNPENLEKNFNKEKSEKKILITIDDGFSSFYENAWPYLKEKKIPFILFISTEAVGKKGYMSWDQIKEVEKVPTAFIGNHSHSHDYLVNFESSDFLNDIKTANKIFINKLGYNPIFFSYPFGEYSSFHKAFISENFKFSFGQHSGVIDLNKDPFELPRFPINEKYGELKRFNSLINYNPLEYKSLKPEEKKLNNENNPPQLLVEFFEDQKNIKNIKIQVLGIFQSNFHRLLINNPF